MSADPAAEAILAAVRAIPRGAVAGYGVVAARAGLPKRARLVARVLSQLADGSKVPWHRVVRANGCIAFPPGSEGFGRQRERLLAEGCQVADNGRVTVRQSPDTLDAALWADYFDQEPG
ncbi:MAG: MGMT family protein [Rhodanobacteraceae bacterium]|nr:MGMT family protein [Rhodanobacteraceae bacterium]